LKKGDFQVLHLLSTKPFSFDSTVHLSNFKESSFYAKEARKKEEVRGNEGSLPQRSLES